MATGWETIGVRTVLALGQAKVEVTKAQGGDSNDEEIDALYEYVEHLERALLELGVKIHDNGAVSRAESDDPSVTRPEVKGVPRHERLTLLSMRPGHAAGAGCSCGWHSHSKTFEQHLTEVTTTEGQD